MDSSCPRCGATLLPVDDSPAHFCGRCGLPQLRVSEDAQVSAATLPLQMRGGEVDGNGNSVSPELIDWWLALRVIALAAVLGTVPPSLLHGALTGGLVGGMALIMMPLLTLGVLSVYQRQRPRRRMSQGVGARLGGALGAVAGSLIALVTGITGFVLRYGYHSQAVDDKLNEATNAMLAQLATSPTPMPQELISFVRSPEFLAGSYLMGHVITLMLLVLAGTICGWLGGAMLKARRQRGPSV
jgi:hypothetical protein